MENREYYTPEIDELFVGYECEIFAWAKSGDEGFQEKWRRSTLSEVSIRKDFGNIPEGMKAKKLNFEEVREILLKQNVKPVKLTDLFKIIRAKNKKELKKIVKEVSLV